MPQIVPTINIIGQWLMYGGLAAMIIAVACNWRHPSSTDSSVPPPKSIVVTMTIALAGFIVTVATSI